MYAFLGDISRGEVWGRPVSRSVLDAGFSKGDKN